MKYIILLNKITIIIERRFFVWNDELLNFDPLEFNNPATELITYFLKMRHEQMLKNTNTCPKTLNGI